MSDYTPTTDDVQTCYLFGQEYHDGSFIKSQREHDAEFDRWLNKVRADEREKIARAIEDAAYTLISQDAGVVARSIVRQAAKVARSGGESA